MPDSNPLHTSSREHQLADRDTVITLIGEVKRLVEEVQRSERLNETRDEKIRNLELVQAGKAGEYLALKAIVDRMERNTFWLVTTVISQFVTVIVGGLVWAIVKSQGGL